MVLRCMILFLIIIATMKQMARITGMAVNLIIHGIAE